MKTSVLVAVLFLCALVLWMASGMLSGDPDGANQQSAVAANTDNAQSAPEKPLMKVQISEPVALTSVERTITLQGQLQPRRELQVKTRTAGIVDSIAVSKGQRINADQLLLQLELEGRDSDLTEARARLDTAQSEYSAARKLSKQGLQSQLQLQQAQASLASARAAVDRAQRELGNIEITAPFAGFVNDLPVEIGQQVERGTPIAQLVDDSHYVVSASVPQKLVADIRQGQQAEAVLLDGRRFPGKVTYVSAMANNETRSFEVEVEVENKGLGSIAGSSVSLEIPVGTFSGFFITPATLSLGDNGEIGVKAVNDDNNVEFHSVKLEQTSSEGAWVSGVPEGSRIITLGQGFVTPGQQVDPVAQPAN